MTEHGASFPKSERIRRRADFLRLQGSGRKHVAPSLLLFVAQTGDALPARLGITVSRRVGCAVVRNRVKRFLRESFRLHKRGFPVGAQLVVVAKSAAAQADFAQLDRELCELQRRLASAR